MIEQARDLRKKFLVHAASAGFGVRAILKSLHEKEEMQGGFRPYHYEISNGGPNHGHYVDVNKNERGLMECAVSTDGRTRTVYEWEL